jgi:hypothetical protein
VIAAKGSDTDDAILRAAIREQVGSTLKRLHRSGAVENIEEDIPLFMLAQLQEPALYVLSAGANNLKLHLGVYAARLRGYGDSGEADEITVTVMVDCRASPFASLPERAQTIRS